VEKHIEKARALELQIAELEAQAGGLRAQANHRPFPPKKDYCRYCGQSRRYRARACSSCAARIARTKAAAAAILTTVATLRAEHAIAIRSMDELVADIRLLEADKPRGWRKQQRVLEVETMQRFWDGVPTDVSEESVSATA
jgi:hypothetical protein